MFADSRKSALFCLVFAFLSVRAPSAWGAPPAIRDELTESARKDWDAARELYDAGNYRGALVHFERAYETSKNPRVLFNVGVCWKELTEYAQAIRVWERALSFKERLSPEDVAKLEFAIQAARPFVSKLRLESNESGAVLSIDGTEVGKTPFVEDIPINVGRRKVTLAKEGFITAETVVDVVQGQPVSLTMNLTPARKMGTVSISITGPANATLFMDGRELGPAPYRGEVIEGPHTFEARAPGYHSSRQTSEVKYGKTLNISFTLAKALNEGKVRIITDHPDAYIRIDGVVKGQGAWVGILPAGGHQLIVEKPEYRTVSQELSLSQGQERTVQIRLEKKPSWLWWTVGIAAVVGGGTVAAVMLARPTETSVVNGTLDTVSTALTSW